MEFNYYFECHFMAFLMNHICTHVWTNISAGSRTHVRSLLLMDNWARHLNCLFLERFITKITIANLANIELVLSVTWLPHCYHADSWILPKHEKLIGCKWFDESLNYFLIWDMQEGTYSLNCPKKEVMLKRYIYICCERKLIQLCEPTSSHYSGPTYHYRPHTYCGE